MFITVCHIVTQSSFPSSYHNLPLAKYSISHRTLANRFIHLTNYSINRLNSEYVSNNSDKSTKGHKWSLQALWNFFRTQGVDAELVWADIKDLVVKTILSTEASLVSAVNANCRVQRSIHEIFGFDVILDENLRPWLLEVNVSPRLVRPTSSPSASALLAVV
ncbi:unnamed protein product [Protopolystoma xenopodis]|uniref:Tubulin--tyrosine ligase-like protein 9 n=1 Tax=Protopolystoma xenopodis TaxID=117903 RepID=A0A3S5CHD9_9PLAT|nr:unnamed protein product [Protopolystoma xenopodis]